MSDGGGLTSEDAERYGTPEDPSRWRRFKDWYLDLETVDRVTFPIAMLSLLHFAASIAFFWVFIVTTDMDGKNPLVSKAVLLLIIGFALAVVAFFTKMIGDDF